MSHDRSFNASHTSASPASRRTVLKAGVGVAAAAVAGTALTAAASSTAAGAATGDRFGWIIDCDGWGARPPSGQPSLSAIRTNKIIVHHMAFPNVTDYSREQALALARECQDLHMDRNGWLDTDQQFTVSRGGYVLEGRHGSLEALRTGQAQIVSAHCPGENGRAIGIESEGTYLTETPPIALLVSLTRLCITICRQYGLHAHDIFGHWDFRDTQCPGIAFYGQFPMLRRWVASGLGTRPSEIPVRRWPDIWRFVGGPVVKVAQYLLNEQGYQLATDGAFGPLTVAAVQDWQGRNQLPVDVDATLTQPTWESLLPDLRPGPVGPAVSGLQYILANKGFELEPTGAYDHETKQAVRRLQRLHGLRPDGRLGRSTWCAVVGGVVREAFE